MFYLLTLSRQRESSTQLNTAIAWVVKYIYLEVIGRKQFINYILYLSQVVVSVVPCDLVSFWVSTICQVNAYITSLERPHIRFY